MIRWFARDLRVKRLQTDQSVIFLIGVERYDMENCLRLSEYLSIMKPNCIITQLTSDDPLLINTETNVLQA